MAKVTIITAVYNKAPWLERCFDSFINQTFKDLEILVVNDCSTDNSLDIIERYKSKDSRIKIINLEKNLGPSGAFATGVDNVNTEYFTICDADDYIELNYIEILYKKIEEQCADICMCTNDMVWDDGTVKINKRPPMSEMVFTKKDVPKLLPQLLDHHSNEYLGYYLAELGATWGKLYRTEFIITNGFNYDRELWQWNDWLFNLKVFKKISKIVYTEDTCYHFFQSDGSITRDTKMNWLQKDRKKIAMDKIEAECEGMLDNALLDKAYSRFVYINAAAAKNYYIKHFPKDTSISDIRKVGREIKAWPQVVRLNSNKKGYFSLLDRIQIFNLKHNVVILQVIIIKILLLGRKK